MLLATVLAVVMILAAMLARVMILADVLAKDMLLHAVLSRSCFGLSCWLLIVQLLVLASLGKPRPIPIFPVIPIKPHVQDRKPLLQNYAYP